MQEYSVGFLHNNRDVILVRKNRPVWQAGFLNGVGGHIEPGEDPHDCMVREFEEETGVRLGPWEHFLTLEGTTARVYCFAVYDEWGDYMSRIRTVTDEKIERWPMDALNNNLVYGHSDSRTVPNLKWMIPLMNQRANYRHPITIEFHGEAK